ncbi:MAG: serine/threonine-protein kinase [Pseudomonadota bacterium]
MLVIRTAHGYNSRVHSWSRSVISFQDQGALPPGTTLNGVYALDRRIGKGGMGEVYSAREIESGDTVAIKMVLPEHSQNDSVVSLFRREAGTLNRLHHEAIVRYSVFAVDPEVRRPYMAMEFAEGPSLGAQIASGGALDEAEFDILRRRIAAGFATAHKAGIVHRDVSPDNIILIGGSLANAKIIDFGIARNVDGPEATLIAGNFAGKPRYAAPEQFGLQGGEVTAQSDIYSLGIVFAEALSGRSLDMGGTQAETLAKRDKVPDLSAVPANVRPLIEWMLQPKPSNRPASMQEVADWEPRASGRSKWIYASVAAIAAAVVGLVLWQPWVQFLEGPQRPGVDEVVEGPEDPPTPPPDDPVEPPPAPEIAFSAASPVRIGFGEDVSLPLVAFSAVREDDPPLGIAASGALPDGLSLVESPSGTMLLQGRATTSGAATLRFAATSGESPATDHSLDVQVLEAPPHFETRSLLRESATGPCLFWRAIALAAGLAEIEVFARSADPMIALDAAFKARAGFEAQIQGRLVSERQCSFLAKLPTPGNPAYLSNMEISLDRDEVALTAAVTGRVARGTGAQVFLIDADGAILPAQVDVVPTADRLSFRSRAMKEGPLIVIAARFLAGTAQSVDYDLDQFLNLARYGQVELAFGYAEVRP